MTEHKKVERLNRASEKIVEVYNVYEEEEEHVPPKIKIYIDNVLESCANKQQVTSEVYTENDVKGKHKHSLDFMIENCSNVLYVIKFFRRITTGKNMYVKNTKM